MAKQVCYCLRARSPFHFGERGVGMEETSVLLHSDTLFSALCLTLLELGEKLPSLLERFPRYRFTQGQPAERLPGNPPFRISSAFPFWAENGKASVFFLPKPFLRPNLHPADDNPRQAKALKKIQFVSQHVFEALLANEQIDLQASLQDGKIWLTPSEKQLIGIEKLWLEETQPHVAIDRKSNASQVYAVGQVRFTAGGGLFFLVDYQDEAWQPLLEKALRALGDGGIGGERSTGHGQFSLQVTEDFHLKTPPKTNAFTTLSLCWPTPEEVQNGLLDAAAYGLLLRLGWIGAPGGMNLRRRGVRMLAEGSVFSRQPQGALADVKPLDPEEVPNVSHNVWRYGLAFSLPCWREQE